MTRFGLLVLFATLTIGPMSCGSGGGESTDNGGASGSGGASSSVATGGSSSGGSSGNGGAGGGSSSSASAQDPVALIPVDNTVSGWTIDTESNIGGSAKAMTATTLEAGGKLIDGGIEPFYADGFTPKLFIWQNYKNGSLPDAPVDALNPLGAAIVLYLFQMPSPEQASGMYKNLLKYSEYTRKTGTPDDWKSPTPAVGDGWRIQDSGADWWINFYKGAYYVEIKLTPSNGPAPEFTPGNENLKKEAIRFAQALASKL